MKRHSITAIVLINVVNVVRLGPRDPPYVTPLIKQLLRKPNKLRRKAKISQANTLAEKN